MEVLFLFQFSLPFGLPRSNELRPTGHWQGPERDFEAEKLDFSDKKGKSHWRQKSAAVIIPHLPGDPRQYGDRPRVSCEPAVCGAVRAAVGCADAASLPYMGLQQRRARALPAL